MYGIEIKTDCVCCVDCSSTQCTLRGLRMHRWPTASGSNHRSSLHNSSKQLKYVHYEVYVFCDRFRSLSLSHTHTHTHTHSLALSLHTTSPVLSVKVSLSPVTCSVPFSVFLDTSSSLKVLQYQVTSIYVQCHVCFHCG